jgi:beta-lactamase class A
LKTNLRKLNGIEKITLATTLAIVLAATIGASTYYAHAQKDRLDKMLAVLTADPLLVNEPSSGTNAVSLGDLGASIDATATGTPQPAKTPATSPTADASAAKPSDHPISTPTPTSTSSTATPLISPNSNPASTTTAPTATAIPDTSPMASSVPAALSEDTAPVPSPTPAPDRWATASSKLNDYLSQDKSIDWSVSVRNTSNSKELLSASSSTSYTAASTTKVITGTAFLQGVQQGKYTLDQQVGAFPADFQIQELIQFSDNDSWELLNDLVGTQALEEYAHANGAKSYAQQGNTVNPSDMTTFLSSLYQGKLLNSTYTSQLLGYMQNTEEERFLPPSIPSGNKVFHKVGLLSDLVHDVGIVDTGSDSYSVAIYSNGHGTQEYEQRALKFADIGAILFKNNTQ